MLNTAFAWFIGLTRIAKVVIVALSIGGFTALTTSGNGNTPTPANLNTTNTSSSKQNHVTHKTITDTEPIPYDTVENNDSSLAKGARTITTEGVDGERTVRYDVIYTNGVETSRVPISSEVTKDPVDKVIAVGTKTEEPKPSSNCDPNYAGGCVPIANDVDCGGGSGNGPAYFYGTARVIGYDTYGLDRDGDGYACE
jgi:hypothetical protein